MPGQDRTGPMGQGPKTGRGMGICNSNQTFRQGCGRGRGMGFKNRFGGFFGFARQSQKQDLQNYVDDLERELNEAKKALKSLDNDKDE